MKKLILALTFLIISCGVEDESENRLETIETTVKGHVSDIERNIDVENFKVVLLRVWDDWSVVQHVLNSEVIDSVRTDSNGNYSITFDYIKGERYAFEKQYYGSPYYTENIGNSSIKEGNINIRNINAWHPTILKLDLSITNNNYPIGRPILRIGNRIIGDNDNNYRFATIDIYSQNIDTIAYLRTKPNSEIKLFFRYDASDHVNGYSNEDYDWHYQFEDFTISLQDTISLNYNIDCTTF